MAQRRPTNLVSFADISGVGEVKLKEYGPTWTEHIKAFCDSCPEFREITYSSNQTFREELMVALGVPEF